MCRAARPQKAGSLSGVAESRPKELNDTPLVEMELDLPGLGLGRAAASDSSTSHPGNGRVPPRPKALAIIALVDRGLDPP